MTTPPQPLRARLQGLFAGWADYVAALIAASPDRPLSAVLERPDVAAGLGQALRQARALALGAVAQAWGPSPSDYLTALLQDVSAAYAEMPAVLRSAVETAWCSAPPPQRAQAVARAVAQAVASLGLRNALTVAVAATRSAAEAVLLDGISEAAAGQQQVWKRWLARVGDTEAPPCDWCAALHGTAVPVGQEFSHGEAIAGHQPPRVYRNLDCPPRHPNCRCRLVLVLGEPGEEQPLPPVEEGPRYLSAAEIRDMPEPKYRQLVAFLGAALHELGQVLQRLVRLSS